MNKKIGIIIVLQLVMMLLLNQSAVASEEDALSQEIIDYFVLKDIDVSMLDGIDAEELIILISQSVAYGFTSEQIQNYLEGLSKTPTLYIGGEYGIIRIADYSVTINGVVIDSGTCDHPIVNYEDITYIPLDEVMTSWLGLTIEQEEDSVLTVSKTAATGYYRVMGDTENAFYTHFNCTIPEASVNICGHTMDNEEEQWPLITFRDVTYFPLTWTNITERLDWSIDWSDNGGLSIVSQ